MTLKFIESRGRTHNDLYDYEFQTDNPSEYWLLSYCTTVKDWFGSLYEDYEGSREFDFSRDATTEEVMRLLEAMPITALPVEAFYNAR